MKIMKMDCSCAVYAVMFLLTVFFGGSWAACGCRGSSKLYIQYKPPASGWYTHSPQNGYFKRDVTIPKKGSVRYCLNYTKKGKWILTQNSKSLSGTMLIATYGRDSDPTAPQIRIFCPAPRCTCRGIAVEGVSYLTGIYYRSDSWEMLMNLKEKTAQKGKLYWSRGDLLAEMKSMCRKDNSPEEENLPLANITGCIRSDNEVLSSTYEPVVYTREDKRFNLTQAPEGDFWWFEADDGVFAASKAGAPCPNNLPDNTQWLIVDPENNLTTANRRLKLTCDMDSSFAECSFT